MTSGSVAYGVVGHTGRQSKQTTQRLMSTTWLCMSMHSALQTCSHLRHCCAPVRVDVDTHGAVAAHASEYGADWAGVLQNMRPRRHAVQMIAIAAVVSRPCWPQAADGSGFGRFCIQPERFEPTGGAMALNAISRKMPSDRVRSHSIGLE